MFFLPTSVAATNFFQHAANPSISTFRMPYRQGRDRETEKVQKNYAVFCHRKVAKVNSCAIIHTEVPTSVKCGKQKLVEICRGQEAGNAVTASI